MAANKSFHLFGMRKLVAWVPLTATTLAAAITGTGVTAISVASGASGAFDDATVANPFRLLTDSEIMYVTAGSGVNLTVTRAGDSTTAATHLISAAVTALQPVRLWETSAFTMDADIQTIEFPGDGTVYRVFQSQSISGTFTVSRFLGDLLDKLAGAAAATTNLRTGETQRWNPEIGTYPYVELQVDRRAEDADTGVDETIRTTVWKANLQKPFITGDAGNNAAETTTINWSSVATTTDLLGEDIIGSGNAAITEDIHYSYSEVA